MRPFSFIALPVVLLCLGGCAQFQNVYPELVESEASLVAGCQPLGMISETANADHLSAYMARRGMENRARERAFQLGATHIVWLHRTDTSAALQAYRCGGK
jgi:hypothetical protein